MCRGPIEQTFPELVAKDWQITSPRSRTYNCIAWAAGDVHRWWWPDAQGLYYWPPNVSRTETIQAFIDAYGQLDYSLCDTGALEGGHEKVAIYARKDRPTHVARQLADGRWTSKLGPNVDIEHGLAGLKGSRYGNVAAVLRRAAATGCAR